MANNFEQKLMELAKSRGLNKVELSRLIGLAPQNLGKSIRNPKFETVLHIAECVGVKPSFFLDESDIPQGNKNTVICPHCGKPINLEVSK